MNFPDIVRRAAKTAVATAASLIIANGVDVTHLASAKVAVIAGLSAGVTSLINAALNWSQS